MPRKTQPKPPPAKLYRSLGRLLVRRGKVAGLFIPFGATGLASGLYEIREVIGELTVVRVGNPAMPDPMYQGVDVLSLVQNPEAAMTAAEYAEVCKQPGDTTPCRKQ